MLVRAHAASFARATRLTIPIRSGTEPTPDSQTIRHPAPISSKSMRLLRRVPARV